MPINTDILLNHSRGATSKFNSNGGFALIIALTLMAFIFLLLLSVGTLTRVEVQASNTQITKEMARQNALLALMVALGELQKASGPDQRVTAPASIFGAATADNQDIAHPHWIGVWDSAPDLDHLNDRSDVDNSFYHYGNRRNGNDGRFLGWLVSGEYKSIADSDAAIPESESVLIVGDELDLNDPQQARNQVFIRKTPLPSEIGLGGSFAYWIADESMKARIDTYSKQSSVISPDDINRSRFIINQRSAIENIPSENNVFSAVADAEKHDEINAILNPVDLVLAVGASRQDVEASVLRNVHGLTSHSVGLLTSTYTGGLKVDLSALLRQNTVAEQQLQGIPAYGSNSQGHAISRYPAGNVNHPAPNPPTWQQLHSWYQLGKRAAGESVRARKHTPAEHGLYPLITRYRMNIVPTFVKNGTGADALEFYLEPIVVLANPYNESLRLGNDMRVHLYFERRNLSSNLPANVDRGVSITNIWVKWIEDSSRPTGRREFYETLEKSDMFDNADLTDFTDSNGVEYAGFTFRLPDVTLAPGEVMTFGIANDGAPYSGSNMLEAGAFAHGTKNVRLLHKDSGNNPVLANADWSNLDESAIVGAPPQGGLRINPFVSDFHYGAVTDPKSGQSRQRELLPFRMAIGLSDKNKPTEVDDFFFLAQGFECSSPNARMRYDIGTGQDFGWTYARNRNREVSSLYDYISMNTRAIVFDIVLNGGFQYANNDVRGANNEIGEGFRFNSRWLQGHSPRAPLHAPVATDLTDRAPNTLYGGISAYRPYDTANDVIGDVQMAAGGQAFWGSGIDRNTGSSKTLLFDLPTPGIGIISLGQLQHMLISQTSSEGAHAIGSGTANLKIGDTGTLFKSDAFEDAAHNSFIPVDQSFIINNALWDDFYFSGILNDIDAASLAIWQSVPLNSRYRFSPKATVDTLNNPTAAASALYVNGSFNVNSTDVDAWKAILSGANQLNIDASGSGTERLQTNPVSRYSSPKSGSGTTTDSVLNGYRELSDTELNALSEAIVRQVKTRGPFFSLSDFVNRQVVSGGGETALWGALEAAIRESGINDRLTAPVQNQPFSNFTGGNLPLWTELPNDYIEDIAFGSTAEGASQWVTQADLLQRIAPFISARSDTFIIRAYGDVMNQSGGEVIASAICEAVVQRDYDYVDPAANSRTDAPVQFNSNTDQFTEGNLSALNERLGRRYRIISIRWL